jgi:hypothetical protein
MRLAASPLSSERRLLGNGERPQFLPTRVRPQDLYTLADRKRTHLLLRKVCLSFPLPIACQHLSSDRCHFTPFRALTLTSPTLPCAPQNALRALRFYSRPPRHLRCLPLTRAIFLPARDRCLRSKSSSRHSSNSLVARLMSESLGLI